MTRTPTPDAATIRDDIREHYITKKEGSTVKEIAARLKWSETKIRRLLDTGPGIEGVTSREEGRASYSKAYRMMEAGAHKVRVYYPTLDYMVALVRDLRARVAEAETPTTAPATPPGAIAVPLSKADAWAVLRALAIANSVPLEYDAHRAEAERPRTWIAERILRLLVDAGLVPPPDLTIAQATKYATGTGGPE